MKTGLLLATFFLSFVSYAQMSRTIFDEKKDQEILFGECTPEVFTEGEFGLWFNLEYEDYEVADIHFNPNYIIPFDSIYVFLGTWCIDTKRELPRFCKIMDHEYFKATKVRYFAFDGDKHNEVIDAEEYYVQFLPTFVFYYNGNELCRIVEAPRDSLEEDILDLLMRVQD